MNLYSTNYQNLSTEAMLFNGTCDQYYNFNNGWGGTYNIGSWLNGSMYGQTGCGCGNNNAALGNAIMSAIFNGLAIATMGIFSQNKASKAAAEKEAKTKAQNFEDAKTTLGLTMSDEKLASMSEDQIAEITDKVLEDIDNDIRDIEKEIDQYSGIISGLETSVKDKKQLRDDAYDLYDNEEDETKKAEYKKEYLRLDEEYKAEKKELEKKQGELKELQGKDGDGGKKKKLNDQRETIIEAIRTVKNYVNKNLRQKPTEKTDGKGKKGKTDKTGGDGTPGVTEQKVNMNTVGTDGKTTLGDVVNAAHLYSADRSDDGKKTAFLEAWKNYGHDKLKDDNTLEFVTKLIEELENVYQDTYKKTE